MSVQAMPESGKPVAHHAQHSRGANTSVPPRTRTRLENLPRETGTKLDVPADMAEQSATSIEAFYEKHHHAAYTWAQSKLKHREDALDAVHDAFVKVMRATQRLESPPMTAPWLYRIVTNVCIDRHRRKRRSCEQPLDEVTQRNAHAQKNAAFEPSAAFEAKEIGAAIGAGIEGLSEQHRTVLIMRELQGMSYEQIARSVECTEGTVMSRLFYARRNLQRALGEALEISKERVTVAA